MVTLPDVDLVECPACGELYPAGEDCECGYCSHGATPAGEICTTCGSWVGPVDDPVAELLDAADELLTLIDSPTGCYEIYFADYKSPLPDHLRAIVTRLQGTAGLSITAGGAA